MDVRLPDGTLLKNVPDGMSKADLTAKLQRNGYDVSKLEVPEAAPAAPVKSAWDSASAGDVAAGLPATRMLMGAAAPAIGVLQAGANVGDWLNEKMGQDPVFGKYIAGKVTEYEASKKRGMAALGDTGSDVGGFVGSAVAGGVALKGITPAATWGGKILQGTGVGAAAGATTPSGTPGIDQTMLQAGTGAALGGGVPALGPVLATAGSGAYRTLVEPLVNRSAIKGRAYMEAAGDKAPEIINALRKNQELVPGSLPTAGEAAVGAGRAEFSALQKSAERVLPTNYLARSDARNAARVAQVSSIAGTDADMAAAVALRESTAKRNYKLAENAGIDQKMAKAIQPQLDSLMSRPSMEEARAVAVTLAREKDITLTNFGSVEGLDWVKKGLDEQISSAAKAGSSAGKEKLAALLQTKTDLLAAIDQIAPAYTTARTTFAAQSKPINQMDVGQYLKDKLTAPLDETAVQKAASFSGALRDAPGTIKHSLDGAPRFQKLVDVLEPAQVAQLEAMRQDLARTARQELMAQRGAQAGPNAMDVASQSISGATGGGKIPNPLSRVVTIANAIIGRLEGKIDKKLAIEIATEMLDPKVVASILEKEAAKVVKQRLMSSTVNSLRNPATAIAVQNALISQD